MTNINIKGSIHDEMGRNRLRTIFLLLMFPVIILGLSYVGLLLAILFSKTPSNISPIDLANEMMKTTGFYVLIAVFIWSLISYFLGSRMIMAFAGAKPISKSESPELYRSVENVSISAGLPKTPDIYIIEDASLNAFATGTNPSNAKVAISRGLLNKLTKPEIEAVMAHEIGHVVNRDIRVMLISVAVVGAIGMIGEILLRTGGLTRNSDNNKSGTALFIIGILFITIGTLIATLTRLAISREREFLADASSAYFTNNPLALVSALKKISEDARIEVLDGKASMTGLCIADPTAKGHKNHKKTLFNMANANALSSQEKQSLWSKIWSTHPPMSERISRLQQY